MKVDLRRWETWLSLLFVGLTTAMTVELVPPQGIWHKLALLALGLLGSLGFAAGKPVLGAPARLPLPPPPEGRPTP